MAGGQVSEEELEGVLMQAMFAAKHIWAPRDRLLQHRLRLLQLTPSDYDAPAVQDLASDIFKVYFLDILSGVRCAAACLGLAAKTGALHAHKPAFAAMPDEQLYDALVALRLPARPTNPTEAFSSAL